MLFNRGGMSIIWGLLILQVSMTIQSVVVNTAQLQEKIGDCRVIAIDIPPENLGIPVCQIINPPEFSIRIDDFITAGTTRLEHTGGDNLSTLEPLYIQKFPVKQSK